MSVLETVRECRIGPPREANPRIPEELDRLVVKALAKDPDERFQDAAEMGKGLDRVLRERPAPSATELARFMELLFDRDEREEAVPEDHALPETRGRRPGPSFRSRSTRTSRRRGGRPAHHPRPFRGHAPEAVRNQVTAWPAPRPADARRRDGMSLSKEQTQYFQTTLEVSRRQIDEING